MGAAYAHSINLGSSDVEPITLLWFITSVSFRSNMRITTDALLVSLVFLLRVERGVSQHGNCTDSQCFGVFQEAKNFTDAGKWCQSHGGNLMTVPSVEAHEEVERLVCGLGGSYWIGLQLPDGKCPDAVAPLLGYRWVTKKDTGFQNWLGVPNTTCSTKCVSVSQENNNQWWQENCDGLNGFLCEYSFTETCKPLVLRAGEYAKYTVMEFEVSGLASYPQGAVATENPSGFKHICFSSQWIQAPWFCEVMKGGCEHRCTSFNHSMSCACPPGHKLKEDKVSCYQEDPCVGCAHHCLKEGDTYACGCNAGYTLAENGKGCVDVNECHEKDRCPNKDYECVNTEGSFECRCKRGFVREDGVCVNNEICSKCEHMICEKIHGVYQCLCGSGFIVSVLDPTKCLMHCTEQQCPIDCVADPEKPLQSRCNCPDGYITTVINGSFLCVDMDECQDLGECEHACNNTYGSYTCSCYQGFVLHSDGYSCIASEEGSGSTTPYDRKTNLIRPTPIPAYVKTGSVFGIVMFVALCLSLLYFLMHQAQKRCGKFGRSLRSADFDIVHLQQVTTEKYKRFSFDKQSKNDLQRQLSDC